MKGDFFKTRSVRGVLPVNRDWMILVVAFFICMLCSGSLGAFLWWNIEYGSETSSLDSSHQKPILDVVKLRETIEFYKARDTR